ncbi:DUF3108 domain-containing protein [Pseudohoeflea coraliihabitans]|uniref:DUF3108 domain-containing protein n=1 Tax=Pseudohoeflea coraliihabitans TaxID=2860393 RepID=A0ABS6WKP5_9HYPH|nr:DUF3108 domain-containing protein [Pseudohoeflea sp. DP4N28-3]MBW3096532.1 DUF3108 domain-containing protein [Pseudohoeflea sp. DP4N28-3]
MMSHKQPKACLQRVRASRQPALGLLAAASLIVAVMAPAAVRQVQASESYTSAYSVSFIGIPVATLNFSVRIDGKAFEISGDMATTFLADMLDPTRGNVRSEGQIVDGRFKATRFEVRYQSGSEPYRATMSLRNGNVRSTTVEPKKKRSGDWVPVSKADMRSIVDPLTSLIFAKGNTPCPATVPVFDGVSRFDLKLTPKGKRPFRTEGYAGDTTVCAVRFTPKSGYRKSSSSIEAMRRQSGMEVWFARHPQGGYMAPVYAKVPTKYGNVIIAARKFGS